MERLTTFIFVFLACLLSYRISYRERKGKCDKSQPSFPYQRTGKLMSNVKTHTSTTPRIYTWSIQRSFIKSRRDILLDKQRLWSNVMKEYLSHQNWNPAPHKFKFSKEKGRNQIWVTAQLSGSLR